MWRPVPPWNQVDLKVLAAAVGDDVSPLACLKQRAESRPVDTLVITGKRCLKNTFASIATFH